MKFERPRYIMAGLAFAAISILLFAQFALAVSSNQAAIYNQFSTVLGYCDVKIIAVGSTYYAQDCNTQAIEYTHTDVNQLLSDVNNDADLLPDGGVIVVGSGTYNAGATKSEAVFTKSVTLIGYGATFSAPTDRTGAKMIKQDGVGKDLKIYGLTLDGNNRYGVLVGADANDNIGTILVQDVLFRDIYSFGISAGSNSGTQMTNLRIIVDNSQFLNNGTHNALNEAVTSDSAQYVSISNSKIAGNKAWYLSARVVNIDNVIVNATGYTGGQVSNINAENIDIHSLVMENQGIFLRSYGDIHQDFRYGSAKRINIDGYTERGTASVLEIEPYDDSANRIENVHLKNINLLSAEPRISTFQTQTQHSKVDVVKIENLYLQAFSANNAAVYTTNTSIDVLIVDGFKSPAAWNANGSPLRVSSTNQNVTVGLAEFRNFAANPPTYVSTVTDGGASRVTTMNVKSPLLNGANQNRMLGSGTANLKFYAYCGTSVINNGQTNANVTHNLAFTPASGEITWTWAEDPTNDPTIAYVNAITSTQFRLNINGSPGGSNLDFGWCGERRQ